MYEMSCMTATGKEFEVRFMGATVVGVTSVLYIEIVGHDLVELVPVFADPDETETIKGLIKGKVSKTFTGYTELIEAIVLAESKNIRIALTVPMDTLGE